MRAALLQGLGETPSVSDIEDPDDNSDLVRVEVEAATLNPADIAIGSGSFYAGHPPLPYVPGLEAVGRLTNGRRVYVTGDGLGIRRHGGIRESLTVDPGVVIEIGDKVEAATACALGTAGLAGWLAMRWRADVTSQDVVLVLGATGSAGTIAVQAARLAGAERVVAAGRDPAADVWIASRADTYVEFRGPEDLESLVTACSPGATVVFDPLWGPPLELALAAVAPGARVVHIGAAAGAQATLPSAVVRGKRLTLMGYSNFGVPRELARSAYMDMIAAAATGSLAIPVEQVSVEDVAAAWVGTAEHRAKYALVFE